MSAAYSLLGLAMIVGALVAGPAGFDLASQGAGVALIAGGINLQATAAVLRKLEDRG